LASFQTVLNGCALQGRSAYDNDNRSAVASLTTSNFRPQQVLNRLPDVPYHLLVLSIPWQLRVVILVNREAGLNLLFNAAAEAIQQWARQAACWAARQEQYTGTNPLFCPCCHTPMVLLLVLFGRWDWIESHPQLTPSVLPVPAALRRPG